MEDKEAKRASLAKLMRQAAVPLAASGGAPSGAGGNGGGSWGSRGRPVPHSRDLERILALPRREPLDLKSARADAMVDLINERYSNGIPAGGTPDKPCRCREHDPRRFKNGAIGCITSVLPIQAWTLYEMGIVGGAIGSIVVGGGKTILNILSIFPLGVQKALVLIPSNLLKQFWTDYQLLAEHFNVPSVWIEGINRGREIPGMPKIYVLPYGLLSRPGRSGYIDDLKPQAIICDEADKLADIRGSATARRVLRYYVEHSETRFAGWTGSLSDKKISEYCLDASTKVLTADLRWVTVNTLQVGDSLVGFDEELKGATMKPAAVEAVKVVTQPRVRITTTRGTVICSDLHKWVLRGRARTYEKKGYSQIGWSASRPGWIDAKDVRPGDMLAYYVEPWEHDTSYEGGYLAGLLDGEGWVTSNGLVGFAQNEGPVLERYKAGLDSLGIPYTVSPQGGGKGNCQRVLPSGNLGGSMRLLGSIRPGRLLEKAGRAWEGKRPYGKHTRHARVLDVEVLPPGEVYAVQTSTGTLIADGLLSHNSHLVVMALKDNAPVPHDPQEVTNWGMTIDVSDCPAEAGALRAFMNIEESIMEDETRAVRRAYGRRLADTMGIITTSENEVMVAGKTTIVEVVVAERAAPAIPARVQMALEFARGNVRPDKELGFSPGNEELDSPMEKGRVIAEIASGIMNVWEFPPTNADRTKFVAGGVPQQNKIIDEWYEHRAPWNKATRTQCIIGTPYMDSPYLCEIAAARAHGDIPKDFCDHKPACDKTKMAPAMWNLKHPEWPAYEWPAWRDIRKQVKPLAVAKRIDPFLVDDAAKWASDNKGIVWYSLVEFGEWVAEKAGLPLHGGGSKAEDNLKREKGDRSIIASIDSHGRGRNGLQFLFDQQLITQIPSSARRWEQLLGRLIRLGQASDDVVTWIYMHVPELRKAIEQALKRSEYAGDTLRMKLKLLKGWEKYMGQ